MTIVGFVFAIFNGTLEEVNKAIFDGAKEAVTLCIGLISILVFWLGMMRIAEESGLLDKVVKAISSISKTVISRCAV